MLKFNEALTDFNTQYPNSTLSYVWQKGDRVRFLMRGAAGATSGVWYVYPDYYDYEIIGYEGIELICQNIDYTGLVISDNSIVEVYTPKKDIGEQVFWEIGECLEIGDAGLATRYHKGNIQNQSSTQPSKHIINSGDCYIKARHTSSVTGKILPYIGTYFPCESDSISDFYISDSSDYGRINIVDRNMKQRTLVANFRWGNALVQNTQINGISEFLSNYSEQLSDKFGTIRKMIECGNVLKIIQDTKVTSVYIGLASTGEADGTNNLYIKDVTIGTIRVPIENYGTKNPESVVTWNRAVYFFDIINGCVVRDAANGLFPISDYGRRNDFLKLRDKLDLNTLAIGGYDKDKEQYMLSVTSNTYENTFSFCEMLNEWKSDYSFVPEGYGYSGNCLLSFKDGNVWEHNTNEYHNNFFGVQYPQQVTFVINADYTSVKRFLSLAYDSNKIWSAVTIRIPASDQYPIGMLSRLKENKFAEKEGFYYAEFMQDMLTPGFKNELEALLNGRDLIGKSIEITLENWHTERVVLFSAYVNLNISPLSGAK
jgi:hypothetical protein